MTSDSATTLLSRLRDPDNLADPKLLAMLKDPPPPEAFRRVEDLHQRIADCMTWMFRQPKNGGNPFLFSIAVSKAHVLVADKELADIAEKVRGVRPSFTVPCATAATDGKVFYWHPGFLAKLTKDEVPVVMEHEVYHVMFRHSERMRHAFPRTRNIAMDYVNNSCMEENVRVSGRKGKLWGGNLGEPVLYKDFLAHIDGVVDHFPAGGPPRVFADIAVYKRSPESLYDEIMEHWEKSPRKCKKCGALSLDPKTGKPKPPGPCQARPKCKHDGSCCPVCGVSCDGDIGYGDGIPAPMDDHVPTTVSKQEMDNEILKAAANCKGMRGLVPAGVEEIIGELTKPVIRFADILFSDCMRMNQEAGLRNDWSRPRKRWLQCGLYLPHRHSSKPRLLFLLDTSGSMSKKDMAFIISQLKVVASRGVEVVVVPVDAEPHWDAVTTIEKIDDLKKVKVKGRGGTVFEEFFRDFPKHVGTDFDAIGIGTDGDCGTIPMKYKPPVPVNWVLTAYREEWKPSFGRTIPHNHERM